MQIAIDADTRLVIATGDPQLGNRNDSTVYRSPGIDQQVADRPVMTDNGYQGNPQVIMPFRKPRDGSGLPESKEDLNVTHRKIHARTLARMKCWKIRRAASTNGPFARPPPERMTSGGLRPRIPA